MEYARATVWAMVVTGLVCARPAVTDAEPRADAAYEGSGTDPERPPPSPEPDEARPPRVATPESAPPDVANAPLPTEAGGVLIPRDRSTSAWMAIPRSVLFVPRVLLEIPFAVPRYALWAYSRYELRDRFMTWFFNDDETLGLYPTLFVETGFGLNVGARFVYREILGSRAGFGARAGYGGSYERELSAKLTSGGLLGGRLELGVEVDYDVSARARFFGIGNGDLEEAGAAAAFDTTIDDTAIATRFRHDDLRAELAALTHLGASASLTVSGAYLVRSFGGDVDLRGDVALDEVYDTSTLIGYETDLKSLYGELELRYDSRRVASPHISRATPSTGWQLTTFGGAQTGVGDDPSRFIRVGADAQRYLDLWLGDRVLVLRAYAEGIVGEPDRIPFIDLPKLGGRTLLRGYSRDRFRGHYAAAASIEYDYPIQRSASGYLFVDAGRVWREDEDLALRDLRIGFGGGMQIHSGRSYLGRFFVASSIDGGVFFNLGFDPVFDAPTRVER